MSRLYEALRRMETEHHEPGAPVPDPSQAVEIVSSALAEPAELEDYGSATMQVSSSSRLVALTATKSLGAEKFRALATRLENLRHQKELKSLQIISGTVGEGKTLVAANLALTFAKSSCSKVLLVEGDLHKPTLASLFGLATLPGLSHWWSRGQEEMARHIYRLNDMPLWLLGAGEASEQPSSILQSARFAEAFSRLASWFDWVVVDSTPMQPIVDANLWSRLVDGALLVVREGVTPVKILKKGLQALDNLKLIGVVVNEASDFGQDSNYPAPS
jgi:capsular exopolysaccharide synthesis family protein